MHLSCLFFTVAAGVDSEVRSLIEDEGQRTEAIQGEAWHHDSRGERKDDEDEECTHNDDDHDCGQVVS